MGRESFEDAVYLLQYNILTFLVLAHEVLFPSPLEALDVIKLRSNGPFQLFPVSRVK